MYKDHDMFQTYLIGNANDSPFWTKAISDTAFKMKPPTDKTVSTVSKSRIPADLEKTMEQISIH